MKRQLFSAMLALLATSVCAADINEWTAQEQGINWDLSGTNGIEILTAGVFKFESVSSGGALEDIGDITVNPPSPIR
jgi:hypothetical protein